MADYKITRVLDIKAQLGEHPIWSPEDQALFWVDIHGKTINRFTPTTGKNDAWTLPTMPGCFALRTDNTALIAARDGTYDIDFATGKVTRAGDPPFDPAAHRFNDGKTDRQGRFWAGSLPITMTVNNRIDRGGALYRYDNGKFVRGPTITASNGTAFSPDGRTMYRAESLDGEVYALDYDIKTGTTSNERLFATLPISMGYLDGATVDADGGYWAALAHGEKTGGVARFAPNGMLDIYFEMPVLMPTMPSFGGPDLKTLYVVSIGDKSFSNRPLGDMAGDIFAVETPFKGIAEAKLPPRRT